MRARVCVYTCQVAIDHLVIRIRVPRPALQRLHLHPASIQHATWRCILQRCNDTPHLSPRPAGRPPLMHVRSRPDCLHEPGACALLTAASGTSSITTAATASVRPPPPSPAHDAAQNSRRPYRLNGVAEPPARAAAADPSECTCSPHASADANCTEHSQRCDRPWEHCRCLRLMILPALTQWRVTSPPKRRMTSRGRLASAVGSSDGLTPKGSD